MRDRDIGEYYDVDRAVCQLTDKDREYITGEIPAEELKDEKAEE